MNALLAINVEWLARFERHHSHTTAQRSEAVKLTMATYINTFVVTLIIYARIVSLEGVLSSAGVKFLFQGPFSVRGYGLKQRRRAERCGGSGQSSHTAAYSRRPCPSPSYCRSWDDRAAAAGVGVSGTAGCSGQS